MYSAGFTKVMQFATVNFVWKMLCLWRAGVNIAQMGFTGVTCVAVVGKIIKYNNTENYSQVHSKKIYLPSLYLQAESS